MSPLSPRKCEASFSVNPHQANLQPNVFFFNSLPCFNPALTFLGVTFDCTLSFSKHVSSLKAKFFAGLTALRCISASSWRAFTSTHPLMLPSTSPREAFLACPPFPSWNLLSFTLKATLSFPCSRSDPLFLAKVRLSPTLTLSHLTIWYSG